MALAFSSYWIVGWAIGALVVAVAATVLLVIILTAKRITRQAEEITTALDGGRENTTPLFDVTRTNLAIDRITRGLRRARTGGSE
jgi:hypothetical protein